MNAPVPALCIHCGAPAPTDQACPNCHREPALQWTHQPRWGGRAPVLVLAFGLVAVGASFTLGGVTAPAGLIGLGAIAMGGAMALLTAYAGLTDPDQWRGFGPWSEATLWLKGDTVLSGVGYHLRFAPVLELPAQLTLEDAWTAGPVVAKQPLPPDVQAAFLDQTDSLTLEEALATDGAAAFRAVLSLLVHHAERGPALFDGTQQDWQVGDEPAGTFLPRRVIAADAPGLFPGIEHLPAAIHEATVPEPKEIGDPAVGCAAWDALCETNPVLAARLLAGALGILWIASPS